MTTVYKVLGQAAPAATTETDLYEVPALKSGVISSLFICNRGSAATTFRMSISVGGGATADKDYRYFDIPLAGNDTFVITTGITMAAGDIMRVYAGNNQLSFNLDGQEMS